MSTLELILWWLLVLIGIGGSAICSGLEVGLYSVNRVLVRVRAAGERGSKRAQILKAQLENVSPTLTAFLVWNNMFNYAGTLGITTLIATMGLSDTQMILIQIVVLTPVLLIFAESTPKEVFRANANTLMERFAYVIWLMRVSLVVVPIVPVILGIATGLSKLVGVDSLGSLTSSRQRMADLLKFGSGDMSDTQASLIDRALELENSNVRSEMIPLRYAECVRSNWSIEKARLFVRQHPHSRFPVLSPKGQVVGVLNSIDLYTGEGRHEDRPVNSMMDEPIRIESDLPISRGLAMLAHERARLGIVMINGRDVGMVTRKDLFEPLVGELEDW